MVDEIRILALKIVKSQQYFDQTMIIVACHDLSVYIMKYQTSEYLCKTSSTVEQIFASFDCGYLTIAFLLKKYTKKSEKYFNQVIEVKQYFV